MYHENQVRSMPIAVHCPVIEHTTCHMQCVRAPGQGGNDLLGTRKQVANQELERGNIALVMAPHQVLLWHMSMFIYHPVQKCRIIIRPDLQAPVQAVRIDTTICASALTASFPNMLW